MVTDDDEPQRSLRELRARFNAGLPGRLASLAECCDALDRDGGMPALKKLNQQAHTLAGIAGSFDREDLTGSARVIERVTRKWMACERLPDSEIVREIRRIIEAMKFDADE